MKNNLILAGFAALALTATTAFTGPGKSTTKAVAPKATTYKIDAAKSTLSWNGKKVTGEHSGNIKVQDGAFVVDGSKVTGGQFTFDMNSITCTDLTDKGYNDKFIGHMKSEDFFNTAKFPTSTFKITKVTPKGGELYDITGNMTIKGITNAVTFPATVKVAGNQITATGKATLDRTKYDIRYGSKSFFENIGDKAIYDDFTVDMKLAATK
ncbi:YceI family protein [Fibrella forsythiae]|uniref:YceI family protein n=1 Tax=Fibrella forsythiae TaxID=2817061 RepID=A0ABS3JG77_9BACT|nr:YceI family protein [Fibrella forsythiae]MBO0949013.1 YceI family protein [Fibrella forsythiae]